MSFFPEISDTGGFCGMGEMKVGGRDFRSSLLFVVIDVDIDVEVDVVVITGVVIVDFSLLTFFPDFLRRHPSTADVMTETTMMHKNVMNRRPEVLVSVTQMDGPSPEVC